MNTTKSLSKGSADHFNKKYYFTIFDNVLDVVQSFKNTPFTIQDVAQQIPYNININTLRNYISRLKRSNLITTYTDKNIYGITYKVYKNVTKKKQQKHLPIYKINKLIDEMFLYLDLFETELESIRNKIKKITKKESL